MSPAMVSAGRRISISAKSTIIRQGVNLIIIEINVTHQKLEALVKNNLGDIVFKGVLERISGCKWSAPLPFAHLGRCFIGTYVTDDGCSAVFRAYPTQELLCIEIQELRLENELFSPQTVDRLGKVLSYNLDCKFVRPAAFIPRGSTINNLHFSSDQRLLIYDFEELLVDIKSEFQHIQVFKSNQFGHTLVIDGYIYVADADVESLRKFMRKGQISYKDKEIMILGGGDGTLLNELVKEEPKFVTLVDIDRTVLEVCRRYMRASCGDILDSLEGPNYKVVIDDCFNVFEECIENGIEFDYVFNDLTDVPVITDSEAKYAEFWDLVLKLLDKCVKVVKPGGKIFNHDIIERYEAILEERGLKFDKLIEMVPSFMEPWVFYSIERPPTQPLRAAENGIAENITNGKSPRSAMRRFTGKLNSKLFQKSNAG